MNSLIMLVVQLLIGAAGGNLAGLLRRFSLGNTGNTIAGALGGLLFSNFVPLLDFTNGGVVDSLLNGVLGGAGVTFLSGVVRNLLRNSK